jgi:hypothetical protein
MEIEFTDLYNAVTDEKIRRWLWEQLPERSRLEGDAANYLVTSLRLVFDPPC